MSGLTHIEIGIIGRSRPGRVDAGSAVAAAAYNLCGRLDHGERTFDFRRKLREYRGGDVLLPEGAPARLRDPGELWRAAEQAERRADAQTARQVMISIPRDVPPHLRLDFARAIAAPWVAAGAAVQVDVHSPRASDGGEQPHAHFLLSLRRVQADGFARTKERAWNEQFREQRSKAERQRISDRANEFMARHGIASRLDPRTLAERGEDRPPEPDAPRQDWQQWKRRGDEQEAPESVRRVLKHRRQRAQLGSAEQEIQQAAQEAAALARELQRARQQEARMAQQPQKTPAPESLRTGQPKDRNLSGPQPQRALHAEPWMRGADGWDALRPAHQQAARASYQRWIEGRPHLARRHSLEAYVSFVKDRAAEREAREAATDDAAAPASRGDRESRRRQHLHDVLAGHYAVPDQLRDLVERVQLDQTARVATLRLRGGVQLIDHGDRVQHVGAITAEAAEATAALAAAHRWQRVYITGSTEYRDAVALACALREPPLDTDHALSREAAARLADALRARAVAAVPPLPDGAAASPAEAAERHLAHAETHARASLTGQPRVFTKDDLARPRLAELVEHRDEALRAASRAECTAAEHRAAHPWTERLLDGASRRRQASLDGEAGRLREQATRLAQGYDRAAKAIGKQALAEAKASAVAAEDWRWSPATRDAQDALANVATIRQALASSDADTLAAAARGDLRAATAAAERRILADREAARRPPPPDAKQQAIAALMRAEQSAPDPRALAAARAATKAALMGNQATIDAAARGDLAGAQQAAQDWQAGQQEAALASAAARPQRRPQRPLQGPAGP